MAAEDRQTPSPFCEVHRKSNLGFSRLSIRNKNSFTSISWQSQGMSAQNIRPDFWST
jgi:hypothetical protein